MKTTLNQPPLSGYERLREYLGFTYSFRFSTFKKFPELIPMVGIVGFVLTIGVAHIYHLTQAPDVRIVRSRGPAHEDIGPTHKFKYRIHNPDLYRPIAELEELKDAVKVGPTPRK
ncbi:hypothetical protein PoB_001524500 [Plakobranchus ocellatus]|uniref:Uncharacterized protein n=1 Tax=Plakobranchus ocellatus TaxID=259542 RepID=A0AAV3Z0N3_9GAST|nr:hypothetical protein PoB_001524500 [Plakobranchus ocellatus]